MDRHHALAALIEGAHDAGFIAGVDRGDGQEKDQGQDAGNVSLHHDVFLVEPPAALAVGWA